MTASRSSDPVKGWTPEKRRAAYRRFGELIIQVAYELNVPANELLAYALKGEVPPSDRSAGFEDTRLPSGRDVPALTAPDRPTERGGQSTAAERTAPSPVFWTEERIAELRRMAVDEMMPSSVLIVHFGISRPALAAICHRQRIPIARAMRAKVEAAPKPKSFWSEERVAELRKLAEVDALSAGEIAAILGKTRNSVLGATYRFKVRLQDRRPVPRPSRAKAAEHMAPGPATTPTRERMLLPTTSRGSRPIKRRDMAPLQPGNGWVRLRNPDGRWLRMDGLAWVAEKAHSYLVQASKLEAVRARLPLARDCEAVPEQPWRPRDIDFARAMNGGR